MAHETQKVAEHYIGQTLRLTGPCMDLFYRTGHPVFWSLGTILNTIRLALSHDLLSDLAHHCLQFCRQIHDGVALRRQIEDLNRVD